MNPTPLKPRHLLAIAFHFPPLQGSSGVHRMVAFARYLPRHDWSVTLLTVKTGAYGRVRAENVHLIPRDWKCSGRRLWTRPVNSLCGAITGAGWRCQTAGRAGFLPGSGWA